MNEESAAARLERYRSSWQATPAVAELAPDLPDSGQLEQVWRFSDYVAQVCLRRPQLLADLYRRGLLDRPYLAGEMAGGLAAALQDVADEAALEAVVRRFRQREMVRIIWRDLLGAAPLDETLEDLSELADVCIQQALALLHGWAVARSGVPRSADGAAQQLIVLGMGKLGARELNLSSDIDLIFCFPEHGATDGERPVENEQFFVRLGRQLINVLSRQTPDGFAFRVDMRLRPFGESGPLVATFDAMENYYHSQARDWERYAMVKARAISGDAADVDALMAMLRAFVYRRYIDFGVIESIRDMKRMIERELHKKGMDANVKLGEGGIREIEFIGQAFQLVRGGRESDLQLRPIQPVLVRLGEKDILPGFAVRELLDAYRFLRLTENRIQAWKDEQNHRLPADAVGQARLAASMGFASWEAFSAVLARHRRRVHEQFGHVFVAPQAEQSEHESALAASWRAKAEDPAVIAVLQLAGFVDAPGTLGKLVDFRQTLAVKALPARGRAKLDQLMPSVIEAAAQVQDPDVTLDRLLRLIAAVVRRTAYLDLLVENPLALSQLVRLLGESSWVVSQLIRQPLLLDELLDPRRLYSPLHGSDLQVELRTLLSAVAEDDLEQEMERLRQFSQGNRLRVAAADIVGAIPLMVVSDFLTEIAEVTLQQVQRSAWRDLVRKHGRPGGLGDMDSGFAVIGYGKLGGIELGYGSDLDLVFLHGSTDVNAMTEGPRSVANDVFYARMGQRLVHMLTTRTPSGLLYEADMRLRPNGNSGQLVSSLNAFEKYQISDAWTWEHQALVRARAVAGDPLVQARFKAIRHQVLCLPRDPDKLLDEVRDMRQKMRDSLDRSDGESFHIKQGAGGLVDIEFLVQYAVLRWANEHPDLTEWTDNARLLQRLAAHRLLPEGAADQLWNAYQLYRGVVHRRALQEVGSLVPAVQLVEERAMVRDIWDGVMGR
ncbi:MAG: bifunctional [glutamate--ammonia ligase]-adenylyl-L-tyrosine phosphorylase/[glutamate--ammonia-ligase] adenylyltransferase [Chromatiaceae bacterium]|nr:bifunctional [glutamate--ammonia ligase]-adenylyl-L-tyrosine phosphorylase/[glutamate--ammonia-ligase] adenylyltransferase [Chromatiaceae bacterium]